MEDTCKWKLYDDGQFGIDDYVYKTSCDNDNINPDLNIGDYCPFCGKKKEFN